LGGRKWRKKVCLQEKRDVIGGMTRGKLLQRRKEMPGQPILETRLEMLGGEEISQGIQREFGVDGW